MDEAAVAILCDRIGDAGGAERYWETIVPALTQRGLRVRLLGREVVDPDRCGVRATRVTWAQEDEPPSEAAAARVRALLHETQARTVVTASVFDRAVLEVVRAYATRWIVRVHDHRAFCPNGNRVFPQFPGVCTSVMGTACAANAVVRGCMHGPRAASFERLGARIATRDAFAGADAVVVSSDYMRSTAIRNGIAPERISVLPPALPDDAFHETQPAPPQPSLLFGGRITPEKGLRSLLRALARIEPAHRPALVVAGRGDGEEQAARELAARAGLAVRWAGWLDPAGMRAVLDAVSAVAVPSLWPEPFGLTGIEAQARGRPAIAYDSGGIGEWIGDAGIAVRRGDEAALARAIAGVVDPRAWPRFSAAARRNAERYRLHGHIAALTAAFEGRSPSLDFGSLLGVTYGSGSSEAAGAIDAFSALSGTPESTN